MTPWPGFKLAAIMPTGTPRLIFFADFVGQHAVTFYLLTLGAALLAAGLFSLGRHRARHRMAPDAEPNPRRFIVGFAAGFVLILAASGLFAFIASHVTGGRTLGLADQALADAIGAHVPRSTLQVFGVLTHLGDAELLIPAALAVAALLWRHAHRGLAIGWLLTLSGNLVLNPLLKQIFERARPIHDHGLAYETSYSFPSGHSSGAIVSYGLLMYVVLRTLPPRWHLPAALACAAAIVTIASSRVMLQVHFASDVVAGLLSGFVWLAVCVTSMEYARHRRRR